MGITWRCDTWAVRITRRAPAAADHTPTDRPDRTKKQPEVKVGVQVISPDGIRDE